MIPLEPKPPDPPPPLCKCYIYILHSCCEKAFCQFDKRDFILPGEAFPELIFDFVSSQPIHVQDSSSILISPFAPYFKLQNRFLINPCRPFSILTLDGKGIPSVSSPSQIYYIEGGYGEWGYRAALALYYLQGLLSDCLRAPNIYFLLTWQCYSQSAHMLPQVSLN